MSGFDKATRIQSLTSVQQGWVESGLTHSKVLNEISCVKERLRLLQTSPLFSLWSDIREEMERAARRIEELEAELERARW